MLNVGADGGVLVIDSSLCSLITLLVVTDPAVPRLLLSLAAVHPVHRSPPTWVYEMIYCARHYIDTRMNDTMSGSLVRSFSYQSFAIDRSRVYSCSETRKDTTFSLFCFSIVIFWLWLLLMMRPPTENEVVAETSSKEKTRSTLSSSLSASRKGFFFCSS